MFTAPPSKGPPDTRLFTWRGEILETVTTIALLTATFQEKVAPLPEIHSPSDPFARQSSSQTMVSSGTGVSRARAPAASRSPTEAGPYLPISPSALGMAVSVDIVYYVEVVRPRLLIQISDVAACTFNSCHPWATRSAGRTR